MAKNLDRAPEYFRGPVARGIAEGAVERDGGKDKAGLIRGLAVLTRGEVSGHNLWADSMLLEQTAAAIEKARYGIKARFTHPSLSGDGLGKFLGRVRDARVEDDVVRADLHFSQTAHDTPDGDLADYVMSLAEKDSRAFGTSISYYPDYDAEAAFVKKHGKRSPDSDNKNNYPHARLKTLHAVDAVDDPAANPNGLFQKGQEIAADADALLSFSLGLTDEVPELVELGIDPERGAGFVKRFLDEHGLEVVSKSEPDTHKENEMGKTNAKTELEATEPVVTEPVAKEAPVQPLTELKTASAVVADESEVLKRGAKAERGRQAALRELARDDVSPELLTKALDEGWAVEKAAPEFLKDVRDKRHEPVRIGQDRGEELNSVLTDTILLGNDPTFSGIDEKARANAEQFNGIGLHDLARIVIGRSGKSVPHDRDRMFSTAISTASFPEILGAAMRRSMHKEYTEYDGNYMKIAAPLEARDFREHTDLKLSEFAAIERLNDAGEFKHDTLTESKEVYSVDTYGKRFALTRKTWINDDLNAFAKIPGKLGRAAARNIDDLGFAMLISNSGVGPTMSEDSLYLFDSAGTTRPTANYKTGAAASKMDDTGLTNLKILMRLIKHGSVNIRVRPKFVLVPVALEHAARKIIESQELMQVSTATSGAVATAVFPTKNIHQGSLQILVESTLDGGTNGTVAWYLVADPKEVPSLGFVYLRGNRTPTLERKDPVDVLGIGWRVYHDAGVAAVDWRGIVRAKGA